MTMNVYISGAITGRNREEYTIQFEAAAERLRAAGYTVLNPATMWDGVPAGLWEWEHYMMACLLVLWQKADAVVMLDGWIRSPGATIEHTAAANAGIPLFNSVDEFFAVNGSSSGEPRTLRTEFCGCGSSRPTLECCGVETRRPRTTNHEPRTLRTDIFDQTFEHDHRDGSPRECCEPEQKPKTENPKPDAQTI